MPYLLVSAAHSRPMDTMPHYRQAQKAAQQGITPESWKALIALTRDILSASHNPLLSIYTQPLSFREIFPIF